MDWAEIENIAQGHNFDGTKPFSRDNLSNIVKRIGQGRKNLFWITENVATGYAWLELFNPEHKINISFLEDNPDISEAISKAYPNLVASEIEFDTEEQLMGFINGVKGKLFEINVAEKLNNGERVGDLELADGQFIELSNLPNQEGYDLMIYNDDGSVEEFYQLKATDSLSYVKQTIEDNPDYEIITTSEVADEIDDPRIHGSDIENLELKEELENLVDVDFIGDIPILGGVLATFAIGKNIMDVAADKKSLEEGISNSTGYLMRRGAATFGGGITTSIALLCGFSGGGLALAGIAGAIAASKLFKGIKTLFYDESDQK